MNRQLLKKLWAVLCVAVIFNALPITALAENEVLYFAENASVYGETAQPFLEIPLATTSPAALAVTPGVTRVEVDSRYTITPEGNRQFTATAFDENGNEVHGVSFAWSLHNEDGTTFEMQGVILTQCGLLMITADIHHKMEFFVRATYVAKN